MNISQLLTKLKTLVYSKSETDSLLGGKANSSHTHTKSQITDFPTIPSKTSQLTNDSGFITGVAWSSVTGKPSFATVATSGSYNDLSNKPTIPSNTNQLTNGAGFITSAGSCNYANSAGSAGSCNYANSAGNSDTLDSYHEYSFLRHRGGTSTSGENTLWAQIGIKDYNNALPDGLSGIYNWGEVVSLAGGNGRFEIYCSHISSDGNGLYYRSGWQDDKKGWRCFIDSANIGSQSVNYATNSGYTNWLRTSSHADHLFHTEWDGSYFWTYVTAGDGGYRAVRVERSNSSGYADSCTETAYMGQYNTITYGVNRLQYFNSPTSTTSGAANVANPYNEWFYHLLMSHGNNSGYYGDIALCFHSDTLAFRRIVSGSDRGWCYLVKNGRTIVSGYEVYVG